MNFKDVVILMMTGLVLSACSKAEESSPEPTPPIVNLQTTQNAISLYPHQEVVRNGYRIRVVVGKPSAANISNSNFIFHGGPSER